MKKSKLTNIVTQAFKPARCSVMINKVKRRFLDRKGQLSNAENLEWLKMSARRLKIMLPI